MFSFTEVCYVLFCVTSETLRSHSVTDIRHHREMREKKCELANSEFPFLLLQSCQMARAKFLKGRHLALWA